jgi:hypothetical protein
MAKKSGGMAGWGQLNVALNQLVRAGTIVGYKTEKPEGDGPVRIEAAIAPGTDQAEVVRAVREALPEAFATATVRTRE